MKFVPIYSFIGSSGSGKTTFLEKLIPVLKKKGIKLGVIKHDAHKFEIDKPGKDSYRFKAAGADIVAISSAEKMAFVKSFEDSAFSLEEIVMRYFSDLDMVITEGYKKSSIPKFEVLRKDNNTPFLSSERKELLGIITDITPSPRNDVPSFGLEDVQEVADYIMGISNFKLPEISIDGAEVAENILKSLFSGIRFISPFKKVSIKVEFER